MNITTRPWHKDKSRVIVDCQLGTWRKRYLVPVKVTQRLQPAEREKASIRYAKGKLEADYARHLEPAKVEPSKLTFAELWAQFAEDLSTKSRNTQSSYERCWRLHLEPRLAGKIVSKFSEKDYDRLQVELTQSTCTKSGATTSRDRKHAKKRKAKHAKQGHQLTKKSVNSILTVLSGMLKKAYRWGYTTRMVECSQLRITSDTEIARSKYYSESEERVLLRTAADMDLTLYVFFLLGVDAGLRVSESCALEWSDIDWSTNRVHITKALSVHNGIEIVGEPKHGSSGWVALSSRLVAALRQLQHRHKTGRVLRRVQLSEDALNPVDTNAGITPAVAKRWTRLVTTAASESCPTITPNSATHKLRHCAGTKIANLSNGNVVMVAEQLRHNQITSSQIYIHSENAEQIRSLLDGQVDCLEPSVVPLSVVKSG